MVVLLGSIRRSEKSYHDLRMVVLGEDMFENGTKNSGTFCRFESKLVGKDVAFDL